MPKKPPETWLGRMHNEWDPMHWQHNPEMFKLTSQWQNEDRQTHENARKEEYNPTALERDRIEKIIAIINDAQLEKNYQDDQEQRELLKRAQKKAKEMIRETLDTVNAYMKKIRILDEAKLQRNEPGVNVSDLIKKLQELDEERTRVHNVLISRLHATIMFISHTFGIISPKTQEEWEGEQQERGQEPVHIARLRLPKNILCSDTVNIRERNSVAKWAFHVYTSLTELKKELSP